MALKNIQLCHLDRAPTHANPQRCTVTIHNDDGDAHAEFECADEQAAVRLRNAIRENADRLRSAADYGR